MQNCHLESLIYFDVSCTCATLPHTLTGHGNHQEKRREREEKNEIKNGDMTGARFPHDENEGKLRRPETEQTEGQAD